MKIVAAGDDPYLKKKIRKIRYELEDLPKVQLFNSSDVILGNPTSNIAIAAIYTWPDDFPPAKVDGFLQRVSNYAAITGYWRTTNGARYVFANILANPNINKLVLLLFDARDNGHLLADALESFWKNGTDSKGIIKGSKAANPKFEQVPKEALERIRQQADLVVVRNIKENFDELEKLIQGLYQEPGNARRPKDYSFDIQLLSNVIKNDRLYDDGCRFDEPFLFDLSRSAKQARFKQKTVASSVGHSVQAEHLAEAFEQAVSFVFGHGCLLEDQRKISTIECRTISITIGEPLKKIPDGFSKEYLDKYAQEFLQGKGDIKDEFVYTYHERIFQRWGNQVEGVVKLLKKDPNTRRAMISLWDQKEDLGNKNAPCLTHIWAVIRQGKLELHVVYRSHHLATVTGKGKIMAGEGAFVPNMYAIAKLQEQIAESLQIEPGPLALTDFSGHLYMTSFS